VLGGSFGIAHGSANAALLPYVVAANEPSSREVQAELAFALNQELRRHGVAADGTLAGASALQSLIGQPTSLLELGIGWDDLSRIAHDVIEKEPTASANPRPVDRFCSP
jgi:alcohol dehydrogenase class IV